MQNHSPLLKTWAQRYTKTPDTLAKMRRIKTLAAAFNVNVDSIVKITGKQLQSMVAQYKPNLIKWQSNPKKTINSPEDLVRGIFRCFTLGIAEEWITFDQKMYQYMQDTFGTQKLQMGAQGGIIANTMAITGIKQVITHVSSLPSLQAEQFHQFDNLLSFDENQNIKPAYQINRPRDKASIHWIIEFDKNDSLTINNKTFTCPKSNRFIATYDPALFNLKIDSAFINHTYNHRMQYIVLSGYQALSKNNHGILLIKKTIPIIKQWKKSSPHSLIHLEIASTQDIGIRRAIIKYIAPIVDSCGLNERETIDVLEVLNLRKMAIECNKNPTPLNLFKAIIKIKEKINCPRIQLHMFGLYITIQDKNFAVSPLANRKGMLLAATAAASKAFIGKLSEYKDLTAALGLLPSEIGLSGLGEIAKQIKDKNFTANGISEYKNFNIIAIPAIIIDQPKTLVGMGDTISAFSLIGAH